MNQPVIIKRPKYHPVTGVELDSNELLSIEFESTFDGQRILELTKELEQLRALCVDYRHSNRSLLGQVELLQKDLTRSNSQLLFYKQNYEGRKILRLIQNQFKKDKKKLKERYG